MVFSAPYIKDRATATGKVIRSNDKYKKGNYQLAECSDDETYICEQFDQASFDQTPKRFFFIVLVEVRSIVYFCSIIVPFRHPGLGAFNISYVIFTQCVLACLNAAEAIAFVNCDLHSILSVRIQIFNGGFPKKINRRYYAIAEYEY